MGGMLLQNHIKCGACLEYFVLVLRLSYVSPVLIDLHNIRQCPPTLQVQANNFCCPFSLVLFLKDGHAQCLASVPTSFG